MTPLSPAPDTASDSDAPTSTWDPAAHLPRGVGILDAERLRLLEDDVIARGGEPFAPGAMAAEFEQRTYSGCFFVLAALMLFGIVFKAAEAGAKGGLSFGFLPPFLICLGFFVAWAATRFRRVWVVVEKDRIRRRLKALFFVRDNSYPLDNVEGMGIVHSDGGKVAVALTLKSGEEAELVAAWRGMDALAWLMALLNLKLGLRLDDGVRPAGQRAGAGEGATSAPPRPGEPTEPADAPPPPRKFSLFSFESPEFAGLASRLRLNDAGPGDFAVRQRHFTLLIAGFLCLWLGGVMKGIILADDYFLWRLDTVLRGKNLFESGFQLFFSIGWVLAFGALVFNLFGRTWFVFLSDRMLICRQVFFIVSKRTIRRDRIEAVSRQRGKGRGKTWKLEALLADGGTVELVDDSEDLRPDEFADKTRGRASKWMEGIVLAWLARSPAATAGREIGSLADPAPGVAILPPERMRELAPKFDPTGRLPFASDAVGMEFDQRGRGWGWFGNAFLIFWICGWFGGGVFGGIRRVATQGFKGAEHLIVFIPLAALAGLFPVYMALSMNFRRVWVVAEGDRLRYRREILFLRRAGAVLAKDLRAIVFDTDETGRYRVAVEPALGDEVTIFADRGDSGRARWLAAYLAHRYGLSVKGNLPPPKSEPMPEESTGV